MAVTTDAVQLLGGYTYDSPAERVMRDTKITQIYKGANQIQRIVMAPTVIGGPRLKVGSARQDRLYPRHRPV